MAVDCARPSLILQRKICEFTGDMGDMGLWAGGTIPTRARMVVRMAR